jgi:hypothetical protein
VRYCGTVGKPGGKQRKPTSPYGLGSAQPTRNPEFGQFLPGNDVFHLGEELLFTRLFAKFIEAVVGETLLTHNDLSIIGFDGVLSLNLAN